MPTHSPETEGADPSFRFDSINRVWMMKPSGFLTPDQVDFLFEKLAIVRETRFRSDGRMRVLLDQRDTAVHSAEMAEKLQAAAKRFYRPGDRVAIVVESSLAKIQLRRILDKETHALFISEHAAMVWLTALDADAPAARPC